MSSSSEDSKRKVVVLEGKCQGMVDGIRQVAVKGFENARNNPEVDMIVTVINGCAESAIEQGDDASGGPKASVGTAGTRADADTDTGKEGPALVNSDAYRDGWERIFGTKKDDLPN